MKIHIGDRLGICKPDEVAKNIYTGLFCYYGNKLSGDKKKTFISWSP
jgi:hypothetical protein